MNTEPVLRPVDEVHIGGVQRLGELDQPLRLHLRVLQPVDDADRATDAQILQKEHFRKNIFEVAKNIGKVVKKYLPVQGPTRTGDCSRRSPS